MRIQCRIMLLVMVAAMSTDFIESKGLTSTAAPGGNRSCYSCNTYFCDRDTSKVVTCPLDKPVCATKAYSPHFYPMLVCSPKQQRQCLLRNTVGVYDLTCTCDEDLCNAVFVREVRDRLINFSQFETYKNTTNLTEIFFKLTADVNETSKNLYARATGRVPTTTTTAAPKLTAEPGSEDDEDGEGSGEDLPRGNASPPSSLVPRGNYAHPIALNLLATAPLLYYVVQ